MPIKVTCSNCGGVLHAPDDAGGKRGRCPTCGNILPIPAVGGSPAPAAEPPRAARANPSFGDIALGDKAAAPAFPARTDAPARPVAEPRRQSAALPRPDDTPAARKPTSPFTKPGTPDTADAGEGTVRAWRKARGGLWWVRSAAWLMFIPIVGLNGLRLYEHFQGKLEFAGVLHQEWLPPAAELDLALFGIPVVLGLLLLVFGRLSYSGVPKRSGGRGLALFSALATLTAFGGLIALLFPPLAALFTGEPPPAIDPRDGTWQLFLFGDTLALMQRFGLTVGMAAFLVAEFWFVGSLGRAASALQNPRFGGRVTRFMLLMGLVAGLLLATGMVRPAFSDAELAKTGPTRTIAPPKKDGEPKKDDESKKDDEPAPPKGKAGLQLPKHPVMDALQEAPPAATGPHPLPPIDFRPDVKRVAAEVQGVVQKEYLAAARSAADSVAPDFAHWPAVRAGTFLLIGLVVWMMYLRMVGAGRRAMREWLDHHQPTT